MFNMETQRYSGSPVDEAGRSELYKKEVGTNLKRQLYNDARESLQIVWGKLVNLRGYINSFRTVIDEVRSEIGQHLTSSNPIDKQSVVDEISSTRDVILTKISYLEERLYSFRQQLSTRSDELLKLKSSDPSIISNGDELYLTLREEVLQAARELTDTESEYLSAIEALETADESLAKVAQLRDDAVKSEQEDVGHAYALQGACEFSLDEVLAGQANISRLDGEAASSFLDRLEKRFVSLVHHERQLQGELQDQVEFVKKARDELRGIGVAVESESVSPMEYTLQGTTNLSDFPPTDHSLSEGTVVEGSVLVSSVTPGASAANNPNPSSYAPRITATAPTSQLAPPSSLLTRPPSVKDSLPFLVRDLGSHTSGTLDNSIINSNNNTKQDQTFGDVVSSVSWPQRCDGDNSHATAATQFEFNKSEDNKSEERGLEDQSNKINSITRMLVQDLVNRKLDNAVKILNEELRLSRTTSALCQQQQQQQQQSQQSKNNISKKNDLFSSEFALMDVINTIAAATIHDDVGITTTNAATVNVEANRELDEKGHYLTDINSKSVVLLTSANIISTLLSSESSSKLLLIYGRVLSSTRIADDDAYVIECALLQPRSPVCSLVLSRESMPELFDILLEPLTSPGSEFSALGVSGLHSDNARKTELETVLKQTQGQTTPYVLLRHVFLDVLDFPDRFAVVVERVIIAVAQLVDDNDWNNATTSTKTAAAGPSRSLPLRLPRVSIASACSWLNISQSKLLELVALSHCRHSRGTAHVFHSAAAEWAQRLGPATANTIGDSVGDTTASTTTSTTASTTTMGRPAGEHSAPTTTTTSTASAASSVADAAVSAMPATPAPTVSDVIAFGRRINTRASPLLSSSTNNRSSDTGSMPATKERGPLPFRHIQNRFNSRGFVCCAYCDSKRGSSGADLGAGGQISSQAHSDGLYQCERLQTSKDDGYEESQALTAELSPGDDLHASRSDNTITVSNTVSNTVSSVNRPRDDSTQYYMSLITGIIASSDDAVGDAKLMSPSDTDTSLLSSTPSPYSRQRKTMTRPVAAHPDPSSSPSSLLSRSPEKRRRELDKLGKLDRGGTQRAAAAYAASQARQYLARVLGSGSASLSDTIDSPDSSSSGKLIMSLEKIKSFAVSRGVDEVFMEDHCALLASMHDKLAKLERRLRDALVSETVDPKSGFAVDSAGKSRAVLEIMIAEAKNLPEMKRITHNADPFVEIISPLPIIEDTDVDVPYSKDVSTATASAKNSKDARVFIERIILQQELGGSDADGDNKTRPRTSVKWQNLHPGWYEHFRFVGDSGGVRSLADTVCFVVKNKNKFKRDDLIGYCVLPLQLLSDQARHAFSLPIIWPVVRRSCNPVGSILKVEAKLTYSVAVNVRSRISAMKADIGLVLVTIDAAIAEAEAINTNSVGDNHGLVYADDSNEADVVMAREGERERGRGQPPLQAGQQQMNDVADGNEVTSARQYNHAKRWDVDALGYTVSVLGSKVWRKRRLLYVCDNNNNNNNNNNHKIGWDGPDARTVRTRPVHLPLPRRIVGLRERIPHNAAKTYAHDVTPLISRIEQRLPIPSHSPSLSKLSPSSSPTNQPAVKPAETAVPVRGDVEMLSVIGPQVHIEDSIVVPLPPSPTVGRFQAAPNTQDSVHITSNTKSSPTVSISPSARSDHTISSSHTSSENVVTIASVYGQAANIHVGQALSVELQRLHALCLADKSSLPIAPRHSNNVRKNIKNNDAGSLEWWDRVHHEE